MEEAGWRALIINIGLPVQVLMYCELLICVPLATLALVVIAFKRRK